MLKILLRFCVCISIAYHCAIIKESKSLDLNGIIQNDFDLDFEGSLQSLKDDYFGNISDIKNEAVNFGINGTFFNVTEKIKVSSRNQPV